MKGIELLNKYPESAKIIRAWFLEKMIESLQTADVPDEFKDMMDKATENFISQFLKTFDDDERLDNITDWGLLQFTTHYKDKKITKEDIFHLLLPGL